MTQRHTSYGMLLGSNISQSSLCFSERPGSSSVRDGTVMIITSLSRLDFSVSVNSPWIWFYKTGGALLAVASAWACCLDYANQDL